MSKPLSPAEILRRINAAAGEDGEVRLTRRGVDDWMGTDSATRDVLAQILSDTVVAITVDGERFPNPYYPGTGLKAESVLAAEARKPTLMQQFAALPHGQQLGVLVVILSVLLSIELPKDVQDQIWGLITTLGAAIWVIQKITRS